MTEFYCGRYRILLPAERFALFPYTCEAVYKMKKGLITRPFLVGTIGFLAESPWENL